MRKYVCIVLITFMSSAGLAAWQEEVELVTYPVRWVHEGITDYGKLMITTASLVFRGDDGETRMLPFLHLDRVLVVDGQWIQARSNRETGISFGLNDVYNFGVVGEVPDVEIIERVNELILENKRARLLNADKVPGERTRYMVSKAERIGDDVGLLIITEDQLLYQSDTGGRDHAWDYGSLTGVELLDPDLIKIHTKERSLLKFGGTRAYRFISHTDPFSAEDVSFIFSRIAQSRAEPSEQ